MDRVKTEARLNGLSRRDRELRECQDKLTALLREYGATLQVIQVMTLGPEGLPRYQYQIQVTG